MQWPLPPAHLLTWMIFVYDPEYGLQVGSVSINDFQQARLDVLKDNTVTLLLPFWQHSAFPKQLLQTFP